MSKIMTILYYKSSADARADCEILGIDKRRIQNLIRPYSSKDAYSQNLGHWAIEEGRRFPITTILKVDSALLTEDKLEKMHHVDDESYW